MDCKGSKCTRMILVDPYSLLLNFFLSCLISSAVQVFRGVTGDILPPVNSICRFGQKFWLIFLVNWFSETSSNYVWREYTVMKNSSYSLSCTVMDRMPGPGSVSVKAEGYGQTAKWEKVAVIFPDIFFSKTWMSHSISLNGIKLISKKSHQVGYICVYIVQWAPDLNISSALHRLDMSPPSLFWINALEWYLDMHYVANDKWRDCLGLRLCRNARHQERNQEISQERSSCRLAVLQTRPGQEFGLWLILKALKASAFWASRVFFSAGIWSSISFRCYNTQQGWHRCS